MRPVHFSTQCRRGILLGCVLGCASTPGSDPTPDFPTPRRDTTATITPEPAGRLPESSVIYRDGTYSYDLRQTTIVTVGTDSLTRLDDTLSTAATLTYTIRRSSDTLIVVSVIDSMSVASTRDSLPRRLAASVAVDLLRPDIADSFPAASLDSTTISSACDTMEDAARAIARDIHIHVPGRVQQGQRWSDSVSTVVCRGGIPMVAATFSTFDVQDVRSREDSTIVRILRRSALTLSGTGMQGSRRITVAGDGSSETFFTYDLRAGAFLESTGKSVLRLRFETIQQTEQVTQRSTSQVRLRPRVP